MQTHIVPGSHRERETRGDRERRRRVSSLAAADAGMGLESVPSLLVRSLAQRSAYPDDASAASGVEHVQTHLSDVFLTRDRVYKLRKAVDLGFVDFTSRVERNADCIREVELNRRLAPDVYLGVAPIEEGPRGFVVGRLLEARRLVLPDAAEHCVVMRRLPPARDAVSLLSGGRLTRRHVDATADRIAGFHQEHRLPPQPRGRERAILQRTTRCFQDCVRTLEAALPNPQIRGTLLVVEDLARAFIDARAGELCERARRGLWVDGHGDLHLQHVWFERDGDFPVMIDCLEFDRELRQIDAASDVAFLAMDLAYRGREDLGDRLLGRYANATDDFGLFWVVDYFKGYRAVVRAKVAAIASLDSTLGQEQRRAARRSVRRHLALSERILRGRNRGSVVVLCGKVGTGKSTVADCIAHGYGGVRISSDRLRKRLAGLAPGTRVAVPTDDGLYSPQRSAEVYEEMLQRAEPVVASGRLAVLDASFNTAVRRDRVRSWAKERDASLLLIEVECRGDTALERLRERQVAGRDASDAGPDFYAISAGRFEPPCEWPRGTRVRLRTDAPGWRTDLSRKLRCWLSRERRGRETSERRQPPG